LTRRRPIGDPLRPVRALPVAALGSIMLALFGRQAAVTIALWPGTASPSSSPVAAQLA
jgi:hypothetical protein